MKRPLLITAFITSMASMPVFAHHPAADMVDPEIYSMIDDNVADTPHADLTFDDMGRDMEDAAAAMDITSDLSQLNDDMALDIDADPSIDTMTMLENIDTQISD